MTGGILSKKSFQILLNFAHYSKHELADVRANIASISQLGSLAGALLTFLVCDRVGRVWTTRQICLLWIFGEILFMTNGGRLGQVYAARFIVGIGFGQSLVVMPTYFSEIAPKSVRGLCLALFGASVYPGLALAQFANLGTERHLSPYSNAQWRIPASLHFVFAGACLFLSLFMRESPRFLIKAGQPEAAHETLANLRNLPYDHPYVTNELSEINTAYLAEKEAASGGEGWLSYIREMFMVPSNLYIILVAMGGQMFAFWSGSQTITVFAPDFFGILGITKQDTKLVLTALLGVTKVVAGFVCSLFLVEVIGRKRSLGYGVVFQCISMFYIALYLSIVGTKEERSSSEDHAGKVAIFMIYLGGCGFALGWNPMMYWVNSETLPLRIRAISSSLIMAFHYLNQYATNKASPLMLLPPSQHGLGDAGTFWFYFAMLFLGGFFAWFFIPETMGMGLEKTDALFRLKWYQIGRYGFSNAEQKRDFSSDEGETNEVHPEEKGATVTAQKEIA